GGGVGRATAAAAELLRGTGARAGRMGPPTVRVSAVRPAVRPDGRGRGAARVGGRACARLASAPAGGSRDGGGGDPGDDPGLAGAGPGAAAGRRTASDRTGRPDALRGVGH